MRVRLEGFAKVAGGPTAYSLVVENLKAEIGYTIGVIYKLRGKWQARTGGPIGVALGKSFKTRSEAILAIVNVFAGAIDPNASRVTMTENGYRGEVIHFRM